MAYVNIKSSNVAGSLPFIFSVLAILPFIFTYAGLSMLAAFIIATAVVTVEILVLGFFLGEVSKENKIIYALKIIPAALLVAGLTYLLGLFYETPVV